MICKSCGKVNDEGSKFCCGCGKDMTLMSESVYNSNPVNNNYQSSGYANNAYPSSVQQPGKGFAIASMVLGIVSFFCFGVITGILAVVFGTVAKNKGCTSGMATAGVVCGVIGAGLTILFWIINFLGFASFGLLGL